MIIGYIQNVIRLYFQTKLKFHFRLLLVVLSILRKKVYIKVHFVLCLRRRIFTWYSRLHIITTPVRSVAQFVKIHTYRTVILNIRINSVVCVFGIFHLVIWFPFRSRLWVFIPDSANADAEQKHVRNWNEGKCMDSNDLLRLFLVYVLN